MSREDKDVDDDNTNHRGARMVFLNMNSINILEELRMLMMIMAHLLRGFIKILSLIDDIKQKEGWSEKLLKPRVRHTLGIKLVVQGKMI